MPTVLLLLASARAATPYAGLEWTPLGRADLAWVDAGNETGLVVGGNDGFARPDLMAYGGVWLAERVGAHAAFGAARIQTTSWTEDVYVQRHWGVVRPALDLRLALLRRDRPLPIPWVLVGGHVDLPSSRDVSNGYTEDEQLAADEAATEDRIRLGAWGGRAGAGVDLGVLPYLRLGGQWTLGWQRSLWKSGDPGTVTSFVSAEAAFLLEFQWPKKVAEDPG
ncbi:MAG: hypothetical protein KC621_29060 [Myxococcales bacterium]|nr:hypothetical protein [Myxococcales bacterium]